MNIFQDSKSAKSIGQARSGAKDNFAQLSPEEQQLCLKEGRAQLVEEFRLDRKPSAFNGKLTGFENLGNTCYMSSILQCLISCKKLSGFMLRTEWEGSLNVATSPARGRLACEYYALLVKVWCFSNFKVVPAEMKALMSRLKKEFAGSNQHDAHEFLVLFLDYLGEDLNRVVVKPYIEIRDYARQDLLEYADYCFEVHKKRNDSFVSDGFDGQSVFVVYCAECDLQSVTCEPFQVLSVPIPAMPTVLVEGYVYSLTGDYTIQEFACRFDRSYNLERIQAYVFERLYRGQAEEFVPVFIENNRIGWRPSHPYALSLEETVRKDRGALFFVQVYDRFLLPMVFDKNHEQIVEQLRSKVRHRLLLLAFANGQAVSVEKEVVVPSVVTAFDTHLLAYSVFRDSFFKAGIRSASSLASVFPSHREALLAEFEQVFESGSSRLFELRVNGQRLASLSKTINLFDYFFENTMRVEMHLNAGQFLSPLRLRNCYKISKSEVETADPKLLLKTCLEMMTVRNADSAQPDWFCKRCMRETRARKTAYFSRLPEVLVVHLYRFKTDGSGDAQAVRKNNSVIDFPLNGLDLSPYSLRKDPREAHYKLFAVSSHYGTPQKGHYKSFCFDAIKKEWVCCDDTSVSKVNPAELIHLNPYLLFYERVDQA